VAAATLGQQLSDPSETQTELTERFCPLRSAF
jgi:hypothetical protein